MRENHNGRWTKTRTASTLAMSALLTLQLAGTGLPTALAQEAGGSQSQSGRSTEEMEPDGAVNVSAPGPGKGEGAPSQAVIPVGILPNGHGTPSQEEGEMGEVGNVASSGGGSSPITTQGTLGVTSIFTQGTQDVVSYIDEKDSPATREEYTLVEAEPAGKDPLTLSGGWYVVRDEVTATKRVEVQGDGRRPPRGHRRRQGRGGRHVQRLRRQDRRTGRQVWRWHRRRLQERRRHRARSWRKDPRRGDWRPRRCRYRRRR